MPTVKIEPNYKVTIPKEARETLGLKIGEEVQITLRRVKSLRTYTPTARELRSIQKGRAEYAKGNYVTLDQLFHELDYSPHRPRKKTN